MPVIRDRTTLANITEIEGGISAYRSTVSQQIGDSFCVASSTTTMAAALAANSAVFVMQLSQQAPVIAYIERVRIEFVTLVNFTTSVVAGRRLSLLKGGATLITAFSGGISLAALGQIVPKINTQGSNASWFSAVNGGEIRIATTGAITTTGIIVESTFASDFTLSSAGVAGSFREYLYSTVNRAASPIRILPGQFFLIRNPVAMDAAGTWQANIMVDWREVPLYRQTF
jgi:hypothetical protein